MKKDRQLAVAFVRGFNQISGNTFVRFEFPEDVPGGKKAVDAIAIDSSTYRLAIEHTLVQPFVGEKEDTQALREVFIPLEVDPRFRVPGQSIEVLVPVGSIPRGRNVSWIMIRAAVNSWFLENARSFPAGSSRQRVSGLPFDLTVLIVKEDHPEGRVFIFRSDMPDTFDQVIEKAIRDKMPKLLDAPADKRVLLLEKDNLPRGYVETAKHLDKALADLEAQFDVWMVNTASWELGGELWFLKIWPDGVTSKMRMRAPVGHAELAELIRAA